jgi:hypothetical protein
MLLFGMVGRAQDARETQAESHHKTEEANNADANHVQRFDGRAKKWQAATDILPARAASEILKKKVSHAQAE